MPEISVLIPVYNTEKYIDKTIESVLNQTFRDFELIILDDCSTDSTYDICSRYAMLDQRIVLHKNARNLGMMANWNQGLVHCKQKYFAKLDADDLWHEKMLEECYFIMEKNPDVGLAFTRYELIDPDGKVLADTDTTLPEYAQNDSFRGVDLVKKGTYKMLADNVMKQGIGLIRRRIFDELGPFSLHDAGDTEMWFRIAAHYKIHGIDKIYHSYRIWADNFTRKQVIKAGKQEKNLFEVRQMIIDYYFKQGLIKKADYEAFTRDNQYEFNKFLIYKYREDRKFHKSFALLLSNFVAKPVKTFRFYLGRIFLR